MSNEETCSDENPETLKLIGRRIREIRYHFKMTQKELQKVTGLSFSYISDFERGKKMPSAKFLIALSIYLSISIDYIFTGNGGMMLNQPPPPMEKEETPPPPPPPEHIRNNQNIFKLFLDLLHENPVFFHEMTAAYLRFTLNDAQLIERSRRLKRMEKTTDEDASANPGKSPDSSHL